MMSDVGSRLQGRVVHSPSVEIMTSDDGELPLHACSSMYRKGEHSNRTGGKEDNP